jgi:alpha-N-arabinofuranosidase
VRDAVLAGLTLNIFHRHAEKVAMANIAQLVNCLQSLFLVHEDKLCVTPTYHVFDMYKEHQGADSVRTVVATPSISWGRPVGLEGLNASASVRGKRAVVTVVNPSFDGAREVEVRVNGGLISWSNPRAVEPGALSVRVQGDTLRCTLPASAVAKLVLELG